MLRLAQRALDTSFERLGEPVTVRQQTGGRVFQVLSLPAAAPVEGGFRFDEGSRRESLTFRVRVSEWSQPETGDLCTVLGQERRVTDADHEDDLRLVWNIDTEAAS